MGLLFTTNGLIAANNWVLLQDDKVLQPADNVTPVMSQELVDEYGSQFSSLVNAVTAKLTTEGLTEMNKQTDVDKKDPDDVAKQWLDDNSFKVVGRAEKQGPTITIGSADFTEDVTLAEIYAEWLRRNGYDVKTKNRIGSRGSLLGTYLDVPATTDPGTNARALQQALEPKKLTALNYSKAQDINGFVVTKETADKYGLEKLSDLAEPAPAS
jgi:osmoprotectant transport system substrate-binding protein